jgi:hypothetical protein
MTRAPSATADHRFSFVVVVLAAMLALAACGGSSSTAPSNGPGESSGPGSTPEASQGSESTPGPGESSTAGDGSVAFGAATTALTALASYAFRVEITSSTTTDGVVSTDHQVLSGMVVNSPTQASSLDQRELDADGNTISVTGIIVIGGDAWIRSGDDEAWAPVPAAVAGGFVESMAAYRPEQMFSVYFAGIGGDFGVVGSESKNGVDCTHYQGDEAVGALLGTIAGVQGQWSSDVWIAKDGGFLVHSEAGAQGATGTDSDSFQIIVDITDPNSAGPIEPPA